ncbi:Uncharacterized protein MA16_Dca002772 [Dendrobium catenatum]|uniref:Uncharacterized protein n=1 Tax=Dendrobium catenatum TaxID=906689 RepID=A0A2I0X8L2_9ASPA|nr:Uncharacterized protein MA16_Dca002772 [Dendrobium catenatum]
MARVVNLLNIYKRKCMDEVTSRRNDRLRRMMMGLASTKIRKAIKKGIVSFYSIDESRFAQIDELSCFPYFNSTRSWGLFRHKTKLQCRQCGNFVGSAYEEVSPLPSSSMGSDVSDSSSIGNSKKYNIKISALQPTSEESGTALIVR